MLPYLVDEDIFRYYQSWREMAVMDYITGPINELNSMSALLNMYYMKANMFQQLEQERLAAETLPDLGEPVIANYPGTYEPWSFSLPFTVSFEAGIWGMGSACISTNGDEYELSVDSRLGSVFLQGSLSNSDITKAYVLFPIVAASSTEMFNNKYAHKALEKAGGLGAFGTKLSKLGVGVIDDERSGEYNVAKAGHGIIDRGTVTVKEVGWEGGGLGVTEKTEVWRSQITGQVEIKKSTKYKFKFVSITVNH